MMEYLFLWILLCALVVYFAQNKGLNGVFMFFISFCLSPIVGFLIVLFSDDNSSEIAIRAGTKKKCPYCAELINEEAIKCRYCGEAQTGINTVKSNEKDLDELITKIKKEKINRFYSKDESGY